MALRSSRFCMALAISTIFLVTGVTAFAQSITSVTVDTKATLIDNNTAAVVTGAIVCTSGTGGLSVNAIILQNHAGKDIAAGGTISGLTCTGSPQLLAVTVTVLIPPNGTLSKGPGTLLFAPDACPTSGTCVSQTVTAKVLLSE